MEKRPWRHSMDHCLCLKEEKRSTPPVRKNRKFAPAREMEGRRSRERGSLILVPKTDGPTDVQTKGLRGRASRSGNQCKPKASEKANGGHALINGRRRSRAALATQTILVFTSRKKASIAHCSYAVPGSSYNIWLSVKKAVLLAFEMCSTS